ncbi:MAG: hypothetical protein WCA37_00555 [Terracidiphilus sp.]
MRLDRSWMVLVLLAGAVPSARASSPDETPSEPQMIAALEARIEQAPPRDQCFLYADLVHKVTEFSARAYAAGDIEKSNAMLVRVQQLARKVHLSMGENDKRLKNAEILLRHAAYRLKEMLHATTYEDRPLVEEALTQVNQVDTEAMMQVLKK